MKIITTGSSDSTKSYLAVELNRGAAKLLDHVWWKYKTVYKIIGDTKDIESKFVREIIDYSNQIFVSEPSCNQVTRYFYLTSSEKTLFLNNLYQYLIEKRRELN